MKKAYKAALLVVGLSISAFAADLVPQNQQGNSTDPKYAGAKTCVIDASTATSAALCASGAGVILQVIPGTTTTDVMTFRDSATANTSSAKLASIGGAQVAGTFLYPRFYNGLSVNLSNMGGTWTVIYAQPK